ncbi:1,4-dihydroxy-2-naphthoate polyprenyltransferase [Thermosediminibacter litoriperuensis]|uniref:1,4-dihydroxy-2-naphthoate octaprenyltransferase n=1 Tax=Thermosediminibacter litoriperuensis TaxID=291989 RepID=A0A5S5AXG8_9FIRM|nr:1,4-dihydroxy-2-naphthoate polyprenyltransferase [Thermosediminibacter litoriperuensis]TYP58558.1 1,4-dihydroxy-2-naphthoate octaprenyltransferase [Thermosediminibacter litoriperuensis]
MPLKSFLELVEIRTKAASIIPFLLGAAYSVYRYDSFNIKNFVLMLISLLSIDMATTAINNYFDYKKANVTCGYNYEKHNAIVSYGIKESTVKITIILLMLTATGFGLLLYLNTDIVVLIIGIISFMVGVFYTFGPLPISRMPLGEIFSGFFMGFVIVFLSVYIHVFNQSIVEISLSQAILSVNVNIIEIITIFLVSVPTINGIANIMLANNICDIEDDVKNKRYTLPVYIGKNDAVKLFKFLYYIIYIDIIILIVLKIIPVFSVAAVLTVLPVRKNIKKFSEKQTKEDTFVLSVKNFVLINTVYILTIIAGLLK